MTSDPLQRKIDNCIAEIAPIAGKLPGVVILHDLRDWSVAWMSNRGLSELGISLEEITSLSAEQYYGTYFNGEDAKDYVPKILGFIEQDKEEDIITLFQQVRFASNSDWHWHFASTKVFERDEQNKPLLAITMAFPIDTMHHMAAKAARLLEENNFLRRNAIRFSSLSDRERQVLKLMALGKSATESAEELFISIHTVETHRKNIRQKLEVNSYYELCEYARAFDLI